MNEHAPKDPLEQLHDICEEFERDTLVGLGKAALHLEVEPITYEDFATSRNQTDGIADL